MLVFHLACFCRARFQASARWLRTSGNGAWESGDRNSSNALDSLSQMWIHGKWCLMCRHLTARACGAWDAGARTRRWPWCHKGNKMEQDRSQRMYVQWPHPSLWTLYSHLKRARGQLPKSWNEHICPYSLLHSRLSTPEPKTLHQRTDLDFLGTAKYTFINGQRGYMRASYAPVLYIHGEFIILAHVHQLCEQW